MEITELKEAASILEESDNQKDEFLAVLAHELRNPLALIPNAIQIPPLEDHFEARWALDVISRQVRHMTKPVDDLLDVSLVSRNPIELQKLHADIRDILGNAFATAQPLIEEHELVVSLMHHPVIVSADPTRLSKVFRIS